MTRPLTAQDKQDIRNALNDFRDSFPSGCSVFGSSSCHGFSDEVIECIIDNSHHIFTPNDVNTYFPIFTGKRLLEWSAGCIFRCKGFLPKRILLPLTQPCIHQQKT